MTDDRDAQVAAVAALAEPSRRRLYDHVVRQPAPVSRDEAAAAVGLPRATVAFHLDRLVADGLLDVVFERRTGRTGPGAGRPVEALPAGGPLGRGLAARAAYDLAGDLLAAALAEAEGSGEPPRAVLERRALRARAGAGGRRRPGRRGRAAGPRGERLRAAARGRRDRAGQLPVPPAGARAHRTGLRHEPPAARRRPRRRRIRRVWSRGCSPRPACAASGWRRRRRRERRPGTG